jgi:hypothetical protein
MRMDILEEIIPFVEYPLLYGFRRRDAMTARPDPIRLKRRARGIRQKNHMRIYERTSMRGGRTRCRRAQGGGGGLYGDVCRFMLRYHGKGHAEPLPGSDTGRFNVKMT